MIKRKHRRGLSLVESVFSVVVLSLTISLTLGVAHFYTRVAGDAASYTRLKVYAVDLLNEIEDDMARYYNGEPGARSIDMIDYSDDGLIEDEHGETSSVTASVTVQPVGNIYGKQAYFITYKLSDNLTNISVSGNAFLREGSNVDFS